MEHMISSLAVKSSSSAEGVGAPVLSGGRYDGYEEALEVGIAQVLERIIEETKG